MPQVRTSLGATQGRLHRPAASLEGSSPENNRTPVYLRKARPASEDTREKYKLIKQGRTIKSGPRQDLLAPGLALTGRRGRG